MIMRTRIFTAAAATLAAATCLPILGGTAANAADAAEPAPAYAAPGAPMRVFPVEAPGTYTMRGGQEIKVPANFWAVTCSQGPVGTVRTSDGTTQKVMLTASHCVNARAGMPGTSDEVVVPVPTDAGYVRIGRVINSNHVPEAALNLSDLPSSARTADWAVVLLDDSVATSNLAHSRDFSGSVQGEPVAITSIRDYRTLAPGEVSVDNFGQPICKDGAATGRTCGTQLARTRNGVYSWGLDYRQGDSGGINYDPRDGAAIGVTTLVFHSFGKAQPADRIIEDAYGVPDGQVNDYFTPAESAPRGDFAPAGMEASYIAHKIKDDNPDVAPVDPKAELGKEVSSARQDAAAVAGDALRGNADPARAQQLASQHAESIGFWASEALRQDLAALPR